jgi:hypothetical protein
MLSFDSKRATITESETYAQGFLTHPLSDGASKLAFP